LFSGEVQIIITNVHSGHVSRIKGFLPSFLLGEISRTPQREGHNSATVVGIVFWAVSGCDWGNEDFLGDKYPGLSELHSEILSRNGFVLLFDLEVHPCSAFASPGANTAQPENRGCAATIETSRG